MIIPYMIKMTWFVKMN